MAHSLDLICLGRAGIDLYGEQIGGRLEDMQSFKKYVGGCPANIAIGSARLELKSALLTKVGADHFGRFILELLQKEGVDASQIKSDPNHLTALAILGIQNKNTFPLLFYRENCADMALTTEDIDPLFIQSAKALAVTGTHFSTTSTSAASRKAMIAAKEGHTKVVFDIDYRPVLWGITDKQDGENRFVADKRVTDTLMTVLPLCDLIVGTEEEFALLGGVKAVAKKTDAILVVKQGAEGCTLFQFEEITHVPGYPIKVLNVLGAGDAFMSGFLRGWLHEESLKTCCQWGNAAGALVVTRHGCAPAMPSFKELQSFIANQPMPLPDSDPYFNHLHVASTRAVEQNNLILVNLDQQKTFEKLAHNAKRGLESLTKIKQLYADAVASLSHDDYTFGIVINEQSGQLVLENDAHTDQWLARQVEAQDEIPLTFANSQDMTTHLRRWPSKHIVKCQITYHPEDRFTLKQQQEASLKQLFAAARRTSHDLFLSLNLPLNKTTHPLSYAQAINQLYQVGVYPTWWCIAPPRQEKTWETILAEIAKHDPYCQGILLDCQTLSEEQIRFVRKAAPQHKLIKGCMLGQNLFYTLSEKWLKNEINDATLKMTFTHRIEQHLTIWVEEKQKSLPQDVAQITL